MPFDRGGTYRIDCRQRAESHGPAIITSLRSSLQDVPSKSKTEQSPLGLSLESLSHELDGSGRAAAVWDCLRVGIDPNLYYGDSEAADVSDVPIVQAWLDATESSADLSILCQERDTLGKRQGQGLGGAAWSKLQKVMHDYHCSNSDILQSGTDSGTNQKYSEAIYTIENSIASLSHMKVSSDGTTKLLLKMKKDGLEVESVIIPWTDKGFSTLCVS